MEQLFFPVTKREAERKGIWYSSKENKNAKFPSRLRELRERMGISQSALSKELGVSKSTVGLWENGDTLPDAKAIFDLSNYFDVNTDYLLCKTDVESSDTDLQSICKYTGLSEGAVQFIKYLADNPGEEKSDVMPLILSMILENYRFFQVLGGVALACGLERKYDGTGDIEAIERFNKEHHEELAQMGGTVWAIGATSDMFLSQAVDRFKDCVRDIQRQFSKNT